jgi:BASS family bile acid:Na+ symporter
MRVFVPLSRFLHRHLLWLLIASYAVAAALPAFGLWMRDVSLWHMPMFQAGTSISIPMALLAELLFNAGLGVREMPSLASLRKGKALWLGVGANLTVPLAFILLAAQGLHFWHNSDEVQNILVGLALVASMPIAGSSTAWSQNADGDMDISLGLVLLTTLLSPFTTPLLLHSVAWMASGDYASDLHEIAAYGTGTFLMLFVLLPSLAGIAVRGIAGRQRVQAWKHRISLKRWLLCWKRRKKSLIQPFSLFLTNPITS